MRCATSVRCRSPPRQARTRSRHPGDVRRLEHRGDAARAGVVGPAPQRLGDPVGQARRRRRARRRFARRTSSAAAARTRPLRPRLLERLEQAQPVGRGLGGEDVGVAGVDGRDARPRPARRRQARASRWLSTMTATSARPDRPSVVGRAGGEQPLDVGGEVGRDVTARRSSIGMVRVPPIPNVSRETTRSRNGSLCGAPASRCPGAGLDVAHDDVLVAECRTAQHPGGCRTRACVAALVGARACERCVRGPARPQVGDDVAAAEGVDRLLGVTDEHQRRRWPTEGPLDRPPTAPGRCPGTRRPSRSRQRRRIRCRVRARRRPRARWRAGSAGRRSRGCRAAACAVRVRRSTSSAKRAAPPLPCSAGGSRGRQPGARGWRTTSWASSSAGARVRTRGRPGTSPNRWR